jgi:hypothetical protein
MRDMRSNKASVPQDLGCGAVGDDMERKLNVVLGAEYEGRGRTRNEGRAAASGRELMRNVGRGTDATRDWNEGVAPLIGVAA